MGHPKYKITAGKILLDNEEVTYAKPEVRAQKGLFLSFQYPAEISGVTISELSANRGEQPAGEKGAGAVFSS